MRVRSGRFRSDSEAQERAVVDRTHATLGLVTLQFQVLLEKTRNTGFEAVPGPMAFDDDEEAVAVPGKPVTASFQFLIQVV